LFQFSIRTDPKFSHNKIFPKEKSGKRLCEFIFWYFSPVPWPGQFHSHGRIDTRQGEAFGKAVDPVPAKNGYFFKSSWK